MRSSREDARFFTRGLVAAFAALAASTSWDAAAAQCDPRNFPIVLDVGHTARAGGAMSARGVPEFEFNRALALAIQERLAARGFAKAQISILSSENLAARPIRAKNLNARVFLSIHHDSVQPVHLQDWTSERGRQGKAAFGFAGYSLFVSRARPEAAASLALAQAIGAELAARGLAFSPHHAEPIAGENRQILDAAHGVYAFDHLIVLKGAAMPAALLEAGVIVNPDEETHLASVQGRARIADGVAAGLLRFCRRSVAED